MRLFNRKNNGLAKARKSGSRLSQAIMEVVESRVMLSTSLTGYSTVVTDIQTTGPVAGSSAYVNGSVGTGAFQYQSFALVEFDPSNSTIFPNTTLSAPGSAAAMSYATTGGTLVGSSQKYYIKYTWTTASGETTASAEASGYITSSACTTGAITITTPNLPITAGATGINVYVSTTTGTEKYNGHSSTNTYTITAPSAGNATVPPTTNTTGNTSLVSSIGNLALQVVNNPSAFNSTSSAAGSPATGAFDVWMLPTFTNPISGNFSYNTNTTTGYPLGVQGQGGLSAIGAGNVANYYLGNFTPTANGNVSINLNLPTGTQSATTTLMSALNTNAPFELVITPETTASAAQFEGEYNYYNNTTSVNATNGVASDTALDESPALSLTVNAAAENISLPYASISVDQNNVSNVVEVDVQRNGYAGNAVTVNYTTGNGTGIAGTDFGNAGNTSQITGTVSFAAGQTEAVISVPTINTYGAADKTFTVTLSSPSGNATLGVAASTVTIIGTTNMADNVGGTVKDGANNNSFILSTAGTSVQVVKPTNGTYAPVNGSVTNGTGDFGTQQYDVMSFNAQAAQSSLAVDSLTSLTLELDNDGSASGSYTDGTAFSSVNPQRVGNFNVYLLTSPTTGSSGVTTSSLSYLGMDLTAGGLNGAAGAMLLGTASFSNQDTSRSTVAPNGNLEGIQDVYTLELSSAAQTYLKAALNATGSSYAPIRLAITPGSAAFAAEFANNNSTTGGNYGIQPYLWFSGTTHAAVQPAEHFAIQYSAVNVNAAESGVAIDIARPATDYTGDTATVYYSVSNGTAINGTDFGVLGNTTQITGNVTFTGGQTIATTVIPIITNSSLTTEKTFTIKLTSGNTTGSEPSPIVDTTDVTTITITPSLAATKTALSDADGSAETTSFYNAGYINGSGTNGTGSFAYQGFQVVEFPASAILQPGQSLTSLTNFALGLSNYSNTQGANYAAPPGDFTLYLAGANEPTTEVGNFTSSTLGDKSEYNANTVDGLGGFAPAVAGTVGPLSASTVGVANSPGNVSNVASYSDYGIPLGVVGFNQKLGLDYFTPTQAALNTIWTWTVNTGNATTPTQTYSESALTFLENQINAGQNVRVILAPGDATARMYFYQANNGPQSPLLQIVGNVANTLTAESVGFHATAYNVNTNVGISGGNVTIPVTRSLLIDSGTGLGDTLTVHYATSDGNALNGTNYTSESGNLTFLPGNTTQYITVPISYVASMSGDKAFTITLSSPTTNGGNTSYVTPVLGNNVTATVFIVADGTNNSQTLTQYTSSVGDVGTGGPVTFGSSVLNPVPPFNFSIAQGSRYAAMDFNDSTVTNYNDPAEFSTNAGPINPDAGNTTDPTNQNGVAYTVTAGNNSSNNTYTGNLGTGNVTFTTAADGSLYSSTIATINEITLNFVNYNSSSAGALLDVYLVQDATTNILPGAAGTSKNPFYYDSSTTAAGNTSNINGQQFVGAADGVGNLFGNATVLGTITNPSTIYYNGYVNAPLTTFNAQAETALINDLNNGTKFRIIVAPEVASANADWIYGYTNANPAFATVTGIPINFYIQPELSFNVSYTDTSSGTLPAYITPSANADYVWDPSSGNLTLTNGTLTFGNSSSDTTDAAVKLVASGSTSQVIFAGNVGLASLTLSGGASADVQSNIVTMSNTTQDSVSTIQGYVFGGQIFSSTLASGSNYGIGYGNVTGAGNATFTAFRYDIKGDTNLDGTVNNTDLTTVLQNLGLTTNQWSLGNFEYNAANPSSNTTVSNSDLTDVLQNLGISMSASTPVFANGLVSADTVSTVQLDAMVAVVTPVVQSTVATPLVATATPASNPASALAQAVSTASTVPTATPVAASAASTRAAAAVVSPTASVATIADSAIGADELYLGVSYQPVFAD